MRRLLTAEAAMWRALYRWLRREPLGLARDEVAYGYLGVVRPILGFLIGLSAFEIPIFDLIVVHVVPWRPARWITLALGAWGLLWMIGLYAGLKLHPHVAGGTLCAYGWGMGLMCTRGPSATRRPGPADDGRARGVVKASAPCLARPIIRNAAPASPTR